MSADEESLHSQLNAAGELYSLKTSNGIQIVFPMFVIVGKTKTKNKKRQNRRENKRTPKVEINISITDRKRNGDYMKSLLCDKRFISSLGKTQFCFVTVFVVAIA